MGTTEGTPRIGFETWRTIGKLVPYYLMAVHPGAGDAVCTPIRKAVDRLHFGGATEADRLLAVDIVRRTSGSIQTLIELGEPGCSHPGCGKTRSVERRDGALWCHTHYWEQLAAQRAAGKTEAA
jgi:hypothetical protein